MSGSPQVSQLSPARIRRRIRGLTNCPLGKEDHILVAASAGDLSANVSKPADWFVGICCGAAASILDLSRICPPNALAGLVRAKPDGRRKLVPHFCQPDLTRRMSVSCPICGVSGPELTPGCGYCVQMAAREYLVHVVGKHLPGPARRATMAILFT